MGDFESERLEIEGIIRENLKRDKMIQTPFHAMYSYHWTG